MSLARSRGAALVLGGSGPLGRHLAATLRTEGYEVRSFSRSTDPAIDVRRPRAVRALLARERPEIVIHLAGRRWGGRSALIATNVGGLANVVDALVDLRLRPRLVVAGSSAQYGLRDSIEPIAESEPQQPTGWYGVTKSAQEVVATAACRADGLPVMSARLFNLVGPGQEPGLLAADVIRQLIDPTAREIHVRPLVGTRDFVDYRDAARALVRLAREGKPGEAYNVCTGTAVDLEGFVRQIVGLSGMAVDLHVERPAVVPDAIHQCGDPQKLREATAWKPEIPLEASLEEMTVATLRSPGSRR